MVEVAKTGKYLTNRLFLGIAFLVLYGVAGGIATWILGVQLTGNVQDLASGISNINSLQGFGQIVWFAVSTLIIAGIAITLAKYKGYLTPFKKIEGEADIPKKVTIVTAIVLGAIISFLLWIASIVVGIFGQNLSSSDIRVIYNALVAGDMVGLFVGLIFAVLVGIIVIGVANRTRDVEKLTEDAGIDKF